MQENMQELSMVELDMVSGASGLGDVEYPDRYVADRGAPVKMGVIGVDSLAEDGSVAP